LLPELHGKLIRDQFAAAGIFPRHPAHFRREIEAAKNIAASRMKESGNGPQNLPLSALAAARRAEQEDGFIAHSMISWIHFTPRLASWLRSLWIADLWDSGRFSL